MTVSTLPQRMKRCTYNGVGRGVLNGVRSLKRYPSGLVFFYSPTGQANVDKSRLNVYPSYSYAGNQYNDQGVSIGAVPAWHEGKGAWSGPAYANLTPPSTTVICIEGDSRSAEESPATTFWVDYIDRWPVAVDQVINNYAYGGKVIANALSGYAAGPHTKAPIAPALGYCILMIGANDLGTGLNRTGAAVYEDIKTLWALAKADGFLVVACTEAGANGWPTANKDQCLAYNALVRSDPTLYDYLLEPDVHVPVTTTAFYIDGTHPTDAGAQALADMVAAGLPESVPNIGAAGSITLTAQKYCLQVLGPGGSVTKSSMTGSNLSPGGGTFDASLAGYSNGGGFWTWAAGTAQFDTGGSSSLVATNGVAGTRYTVTVDVVAITGGYVKINIGGVLSDAITTAGTYIFSAVAGSTLYGVTAYLATGVIIDNLTCFAHANTSAETGTLLQFDGVAGGSIFTPNASCAGWMLTAAGGYVFPYIPPGTSVVSAAATSGGNGMSFALTAGMRECFERSVTDGVEKVPGTSSVLMRKADWIIENEDATHAITDVAEGVRFQSGAMAPIVQLVASGILEVGARYRIIITASSPLLSGLIKTDAIGIDGIIFGDTAGVFEWSGTAITTYLQLYRASADIDCVINSISVEKYQPSVFTAAALCYMDASSTEITTDTNILAVNNTVTGGIYAASGGVLKASDGTNTATVTVAGGWARGERPLISAKTNAAGTKLQIGYKKWAESDITWGVEANYIGSAKPGTHIRLAYNGDKPQHIAQAQIWNKSAANAEIIGLLRYVP